ncbi:hypothetical protein HNQ64_002423 [Prosthecobacter dejongeii]|uniref:Uncharacterized protein n=1 Tax=Prosthecobacter dejongeii TaxID=48465 RepID=A0A7W8DQG0_9BACT|nr:hypothetical protein [Prosthecobacter dejongeii]
MGASGPNGKCVAIADLVGGGGLCLGWLVRLRVSLGASVVGFGWVLDGWLADFGVGFFIAFLMVGLLDLSAGEEEQPFVAVIEEEDHFSPRAEDFGDGCVFDSYVGFFDLFPHVGKEAVGLFALVGIFDVVTKLEGVIKVEFYGLDDECCQIIQGEFAVDCELGLEIFMLEGEMLFFHPGKKEGGTLSVNGNEETETEVGCVMSGLHSRCWGEVPKFALGEAFTTIETKNSTRRELAVIWFVFLAFC